MLSLAYLELPFEEHLVSISVVIETGLYGISLTPSVVAGMGRMRPWLS